MANSFYGQTQGGFAPPEPPVEVLQAALVLLAYAAAFVLLATFVFSRSDVRAVRKAWDLPHRF